MITLAGLDSIAQAAGRCNREGMLQKKGEVIIFVPPKNTPPGILRKASETTEILLKAYATQLAHNWQWQTESFP